MSNKKTLILAVDCKTDGIGGTCFWIGATSIGYVGVSNEVFSNFNGIVDLKKFPLTDTATKETVGPQAELCLTLNDRSMRLPKIYERYVDLYNAFWEFYMERRDRCRVVHDCPFFAVEALFDMCVILDPLVRKLQCPSLLYNLPSMLHAYGIHPEINREAFLVVHNHFQIPDEWMATQLHPLYTTYRTISACGPLNTLTPVSFIPSTIRSQKEDVLAIDCKTDGIGGTCFWICVLVASEEHGKGKYKHRFNGIVDLSKFPLTDLTTKETTGPQAESCVKNLRDGSQRRPTVYDSYAALWNAFWEFYVKHQDRCNVIHDCPFFAVETLFNRCIGLDHPVREAQRPSVLFNLSSMFHIRGMSSRLDRLAFASTYTKVHLKDRWNDLQLHPMLTSVKILAAYWVLMKTHPTSIFRPDGKLVEEKK